MLGVNVSPFVAIAAFTGLLLLILLRLLAYHWVGYKLLAQGRTEAEEDRATRVWLIGSVLVLAGALVLKAWADGRGAFFLYAALGFCAIGLFFLARATQRSSNTQTVIAWASFSSGTALLLWVILGTSGGRNLLLYGTMEPWTLTSLLGVLVLYWGAVRLARGWW